MSDVVPSTILGKLEFFEQRIADWSGKAEAIGLTPQQANDLAGRVAAARAKYNAVQQLRQQAKNATVEQNDAVNEMAGFGSDLIAIIRAFADVQTDPAAIYTEAEITPPTPAGTPLPPPVPATNIRMQLANTGELTVRWTGTVANGTVYAVYREFAQGSGFAQIGVSTTKSFVDRTVPAGTPNVSYYLVALRDGQESAASDIVSMRFGAADAGAQPGGQTGAQSGNQSGNGQFGIAA